MSTAEQAAIQLRALREALDITAEQLAQTIGSNPVYLRRVEAGKKRLTPEYRERVMEGISLIHNRRVSILNGYRNT